MEESLEIYQSRSETFELLKKYTKPEIAHSYTIPDFTMELANILL